jgi:hypothetical protein
MNFAFLFSLILIFNFTLAVLTFAFIEGVRLMIWGME